MRRVYIEIEQLGHYEAGQIADGTEVDMLRGLLGEPDA
jgi:hypothetical protein